MSVKFVIRNTDFVKAGLRKFNKNAQLRMVWAVNVTTTKVENKAKKFNKQRFVLPASKRTGELILKMIPKFANLREKKITGEARGLAPYAKLKEMGTGVRGRGSAKFKMKGYTHGSKPGMKASNAFYDAKKEEAGPHRDRIANAINAVNPTKPGLSGGA